MEIKKIIEGTEKPEEKMLFDFPQTETMTLGYVSVKPGDHTHLGLHEDEEEFYLILHGKALLRLGEETSEILPGETVYVPRCTLHQMTCISEETLEYLYVANYPDRPGRGQSDPEKT